MKESERLREMYMKKMLRENKNVRACMQKCVKGNVRDSVTVCLRKYEYGLNVQEKNLNMTISVHESEC